ncbi:hypothetical protein ACFOYW_10885 [Gryllotalpicola reticulitermitis]|uniref:Uncharacterized protein n=1 Tax=Gryllotalpicola reticulitermitis TaxID=1184153 RepID=A0ABV8Q8Y4_9MICO
MAWLVLVGHINEVPCHGIQLGLRAAASTTLVADALIPLAVGWLFRANLHRLLRERGD